MRIGESPPSQLSQEAYRALAAEQAGGDQPATRRGVHASEPLEHHRFNPPAPSVTGASPLTFGRKMEGNPAIACPKCGSQQVDSRGKRHAMYPVGCLYLLTLPIAMLHQVSGPNLYKCRDCEWEYGKRTILATMCLGILIAVLLLFLAIFTIAIASVI